MPTVLPSVVPPAPPGGAPWPVPASPPPPAAPARSLRALRAEGRLDAVALLDADPDLAAHLGPADVAMARRVLVAARMRLPAGACAFPVELRAAIALLVVSGMLIRHSESYGRPDAELYGPGDLVDARLAGEPTSSWRVLTPSRMAVVDHRLLIAARRWPLLTAGLSRRIFDGHREHQRLAAIRALPTVETRLLAFLSHVASRWGRVTTAGVVVALPVTHKVLGQLVGARRPTVSLALVTLGDAGLLTRLPDGRWLLAHRFADWSAGRAPDPRRDAREASGRC
jgi:CRP-like cAMP-binding protein